MFRIVACSSRFPNLTSKLRVIQSRASASTAAAATASPLALGVTMPPEQQKLSQDSYLTTETDLESPPWIKVEKYTPTAATWPYTAADFERQDERPDTEFYSSPKFVTHIDDRAVETLAKYYDAVLPRKGPARVLDFCSSWVSHYPDRLLPSDSEAAKEDIEIYGTGLNQAELDKNKFLGPASSGRRVVRDLNADPDMSKAFPDQDVKFTASTCTVSIDYLSKPFEVLSSLREKTAENGTVHLAISNRAFWHKVVSRWMQVSERQRLETVGDYLWFTGWREVEIVTLCEKGQSGGREGWMGLLGMGGSAGDPLWVVRGRNTTGPVKELGV